MADAQIQQSKEGSFGKKMAAVAVASNVGTLKKVPTMSKPSGSKSTVPEKEQNKGKCPDSSANANINKDVLLVLQELSAKMTTQNKRIEKQDERIDSIIQKLDAYSEYDTYEGDEDINDYSQYSQDDVVVELDETEEPVSAKRQKTDSSSSVFKQVSEKFQQSESVDSEVHDDLASFVNSSFKCGISDEKQSELLKDIHRPANCESLVKTRVNHGIWRLLKFPTQTQDSKFKKIQHIVVSAASNVTKLLDKCGEKFDAVDIEWGTNALALMGQANKLINNKRKEMHKNDLDAKYHYLASSSLPYTDHLYGDDCDVNKNIREINDMSRMGRSVGRGYNISNNQQRGSFRGRVMFGHRGRGRGHYGPQRNDNAHSKNLRRASKK